MSAQEKKQDHWDEVAGKLLADEVDGDWRRLVSSPQARVFFSRERAAYLKIFCENRSLRRLRARLLPTMARHRRFVRNTEILRSRGFTAPAIVASDELGSNRAYVVSEAFDGMGLGSFISQHLWRSREDKAIRHWKRLVMQRLGETIAELHNAGISHGDLRPDNILLGCTSPDPLFCFIDNERNQLHLFATPMRAIMKNLVQLNMIWSEDLSASYRLRFFKAYVARSRRRLDAQALARRVQERTRKRLAGKQRGGYLNPDERQMVKPDFDKLLAGSRR